uniref:Uncharacterized protein n=1 Tax=Arundo donax TaxID=35708 RepID=A0A0A9GST8_ARUDO
MSSPLNKAVRTVHHVE